MASQTPKTPISFNSIRLFLDATGDKTTTIPSLPPLPDAIPPSKLIPHTRFLVDAFRYAGDHSVSYFLSHFHSDHYAGLSPSWCKGVVFGSPTTARLVNQVLEIPPAFVVALPLNETISIDGCEVQLVDANHCPGAVMFLFAVPGGTNGELFRYVHTGDFRFHESMKLEPRLREFLGCDVIFLDTTYCNPRFVFPSQEESIGYIAGVIERVRRENKVSANVLFLVATYVIGKERILLEIARRCSCKVYVDRRKMAVLCTLGYGDSGVFTEDEGETNVHVVGWNVLGETWPYFRPNFVRMKEIMLEKGYEKVLGFVPTGWTYEVKRDKFTVKTKDSFEIHLVPYSEHSNYIELREFVRFLKPKRVIPTVGLDVEKLDSKHFDRMQKHFAGLLDETANKKEFLMNFQLRSSKKDDTVEGDLTAAPREMSMEEKDVDISGEDATGCLGQSFVVDGTKNQVLQGSDAFANKGEGEILQALRDCLPLWVTYDQMLGLLSSSGGDVVEAVSIFYDRETEFYQQALASGCSIASMTDSSDFSSSLPTLDSVRSSPFRTMEDTSSKEFRSPIMQLSASKKLPANKKTTVGNSPKKKQKKISKVESSGPGQSRITRFFTKMSPEGSHGAIVGSCSLPCSKGEKLSSSFSEEINQFVQIVNGDDSLRSYASSILEKTKGDINMALDLYYGCSKDGPIESKDGPEIVDGTSQSILSSDCKLAPDQDTSLLEQSGSVAIIPMERSSAEISSSFLSLPLEKYDPIEHACWRHGEPAPYLHLARTFDLVEREKGKIKAISMLCNMLRSLLALSLEDVLPAVYLSTNKIAADHENMDLNIGGSLIAAALEDACGVKRSKIRDMYNRLGDLGDVAQECRQTQSLLAPPPPLLIKDVFSVLRKISSQAGSGSSLRKKSLVVSLMRSCREMEIKFIVRTLVRNLRIGAMMRTVLPAFAQAVVMNSFFNECQDATEKLEKFQSLSASVIDAYNILPSLDIIIPAVMKEGIEFSSSRLSMIPGIPIKPMLAKIANGVPSILKLFENRAFTCEYKYDGQRAQIHKLVDGSVRIFSRNGDETTSRFPDLIAIVKESCKPSAMTFILDAEVVAVDRKSSCRLMSFQELSSRERGSRESRVSLDSIKVDICIFVFDIMFANGERLLGLPLRARRKILKDLFNEEKKGYFEYAKEMTVEAEDSFNCEATLTSINSFLEDALRASCEGIMVKSLDIDAGYSPSKRADSWLKVKRDYIEGLSDSLDLVPIGAWHGNGRKAGWYSPFLMACYNPDSEEFQSVCRVMSGFSDLFYIEMKELFSGDKILAKKPPYYKTAEEPDMWFSPEVVWEIKGADFTVSPVHQAAIGLVHPSRGISIRFPRFIRRVSDRNPEDCSTAADVAEMFHSQSRKMDVAFTD